MKIFYGFTKSIMLRNNTKIAEIKDKILRFRPSFDFCYGQIYDEVSNMVDKKKVLPLKY